MWMSDEPKLLVKLSEFVKATSWFVRAIVFYQGFEPIVADQQLDLVDKDIPALYLRYQNNIYSPSQQSLTVSFPTDRIFCKFKIMSILYFKSLAQNGLN